MTSPASNDALVTAPPPWELKGTIYSFLTYATSKDALQLASDKSFLYAPLEEHSSFADGKFLGGLGMVQVIRYTDSPVGPYDELLVVPGAFGYRVGESGSGGKDKENLRLTRIYVSQKHTCWNGRKNWNIPKHLARFEFETIPGKGVSIAVYPYQEDKAGSESVPSSTPFFSAKYQPISYLPNFPMATSIARYIGRDLSLVQPPLPQGGENSQELLGTDKWRRTMPYISSRKTSLGWWDMKQGDAAEEGGLPATGGDEGVRDGYENFWPGSRRWRIGMRMENATIKFPAAAEWEQPAP